MVWLGNHLQRMPFVSLLPTAPTACLSPQTAGSWLFQTIRTWWLAAVAAVLGQLVAQFLNESRLFCQLLLQGDDDGQETLFVHLLELVRAHIDRIDVILIKDSSS